MSDHPPEGSGNQTGAPSAPPGTHSGQPWPNAGPQGFGQSPGYGPGYQGPPGYYRPPSSSSSTVVIILAVVGGVALVGIVGIILAISGTRRYLISAKTAEAKNTLGAIGRSAQSAYERDAWNGDPLAEDSASNSNKHELCPSWPHPIPNVVPLGRKDMPHSSDFDDPALRCLRFSLTMPVYYQYNYERTSTGFIVTAKGDLDADGVQSEFTLRGTLVGDRVQLSPIEETNPQE